MGHFCHSRHFGFYISNDEKPLDGSEQDKAQSDFYVEGSLWLLKSTVGGSGHSTQSLVGG